MVVFYPAFSLLLCSSSTLRCLWAWQILLYFLF